MEIKRLGPEFEEPFRKALGHAARAESTELENLLENLTNDQVLTAIGLCAFVAGYAAIDVVGREWPSEVNMRKIANGTVKGANAQKLGLSDQDVYDFITRVSLRFEPINEVFPDPNRDLHQNGARSGFWHK